MIEVTINSFNDLHSELAKLERGYIFRGINKSEYKLIPSVGRKTKSKHSVDRMEKDLLWLFKTQSVPYLKIIPTTDMEWMTVAQHHGLPTRLLDWTRNPLVATYFAVEKNNDSDSAIYAFVPSGFLSEDSITDPKTLKTTGVILPTHRTKRIAAQMGLFTIHPLPEDAFEPDDLVKIIIPSSCNEEIKRDLDKYGVSRASLFPDMDGLSSHLRWRKGY